MHDTERIRPDGRNYTQKETCQKRYVPQERKCHEQRNVDQCRRFVGNDGANGSKARRGQRPSQQDGLSVGRTHAHSGLHAAVRRIRKGAVTAEYAVVLVAATAFAAVLVAIVKSDAVRTLLTNIIKKALSVG